MSSTAAGQVTGARALASALEELGVTHIFGMDTPEPLYAALDPEKVRAITVHDERAGAVMADAFARVSGRPGVCGAIRGPGATNLVTGLAEAWNTSTPVVALVNDIPTEGIDRNVSQAVDHIALMEQFTKWGARLDRPERVAELTERAFSVATSGRPGPVIMSLTESALVGEGVTPAPITRDARYPRYRVGPDPELLQRAFAALRTAERPVIVAGGGVHLSQAYEPLRRLAEALGAPVATTPLGKGAFDETHRLSAGVVGAYTIGKRARGRVANATVREADLVILVGTKTDSNATADWTVPQRTQPTIHIDIDPAEIGRNYDSLPLAGDAALVLAALAALAEGEAAGEAFAAARARFVDAMRAGFARWEAETREIRESDESPMRPERITAELAAAMDDRAIVTTDASYSSAWAMDLIALSTPGRRYLAPRGFAGLGWGVPAAIGAKLAAPERQVFCLTGDGGFGYVAMELETAARYGVPIVVILLNNGILGFQKHFEEQAFGRTFETVFSDVDYAALAESLGCLGISVGSPDDLGPAIRAAVDSGRPALIDARTSPAVAAPISTFEGNAGHQVFMH